MSVDIVTEDFPGIDEVIDKAIGPQGPPGGPWVSGTSYDAGASVTWPKAGIWYDWISVTNDNEGNNPATDDGTNWAQGDVITVVGIQFDISETPPATVEGQLTWNADDKTVNIGSDIPGVSNQAGQETWTPRVKNTSGAQVDDGKAVFISGASGGNPTIALARADDPSTHKVIALATHDIADNGFGYCTAFGMVRDIDTSAWAAGTELYLSATTAGALTSTPPVSPNLAMLVGIVIVSNANNGSIFVTVIPDHAQFLKAFLGLLKSYSETSAANQAGISGSVTFDFEDGNIHPFTFGGDITDLTLSNLPATGDLVLVLYPKQDAGGNAWDVTWTLDAGSVDWGDAGAPDLSDAANKVDEVVLRRASGGTVWRGTYTLGFGS